MAVELAVVIFRGRLAPVAMETPAVSRVSPLSISMVAVPPLPANCVAKLDVDTAAM